MDRFKVSTKKSLFKPIEIEIDEKVYKIDMITPEVLDQVEKYDKDAATGNTTAVTKQLEIIFGIPQKITRKLDVRDLEKMMNFVSERIFNPELGKGGKEKKELRA